MRYRFVVALAFAASAFVPAHAQVAAPYVPPTISEEQWRNMLSYAGRLPHDEIDPLIQALNQIEMQAVIAKAAADAQAKKQAEAAKPADPVPEPSK